jgi:hypothetical protein
MKICTKCKIKKPLIEFHSCDTHLDGKKSHCKNCRNKHNRNWWRKNRGKKLK